MNEIMLFLLLCALGALCYGFYFKCVDWFEKICRPMFTSLLILSILGFVYLMYVLVKPEKF